MLLEGILLNMYEIVYRKRESNTNIQKSFHQHTFEFLSSTAYSFANIQKTPTYFFPTYFTNIATAVQDGNNLVISESLFVVVINLKARNY